MQVNRRNKCVKRKLGSFKRHKSYIYFFSHSIYLFIFDAVDRSHLKVVNLSDNADVSGVHE